jgi:hypothetical protein
MPVGRACHANRPTGGIRREKRAAALEGIKQLQRASLPTRDAPAAMRVGALARNGRPDAFAACVRSTTFIECVTLSMIVLKKFARWS